MIQSNIIWLSLYLTRLHETR